MTLRELDRELRRRLGEAVDDPAFEARCLLEKFMGLSRLDILTNGDREALPEDTDLLLRLAERRISGEPLQYILGEWDFMDITLLCGEGVLIPRDDTAVLVESTAQRLPKNRPLVGIDLCAGTGAVGLMMAKLTGADVTEVELYDGAFGYLEKNLARYPELKVRAVRGDVFSSDFAGALPENPDFIVSNPPYIESADMETLQKEVKREPETALDGGTDGLDFYRAICDIWAKKLVEGGVLAVEIGETQAEAVKDLFIKAGMRDVRVHRDLGGLDRAVTGIKITGGK